MRFSLIFDEIGILKKRKKIQGDVFDQARHNPQAALVFDS